MVKRIICAALVIGFAVQAEAGIFGNRGGGCPNGQCSIQTYYPTQKAVQAPPAPQQKVTAAAAQPTVEATATVESAPYVASEPARRGFFRRWAR